MIATQIKQEEKAKQEKELIKQKQLEEWANQVKEDEQKNNNGISNSERAPVSKGIEDLQ